MSPAVSALGVQSIKQQVCSLEEKTRDCSTTSRTSFVVKFRDMVSFVHLFIHSTVSYHLLCALCEAHDCRQNNFPKLPRAESQMPGASKSPKGLVSVNIPGFCVPRECDMVSPSYLGLLLPKILLFKNIPGDSNTDQDDMKTRLS